MTSCPRPALWIGLLLLAAEACTAELKDVEKAFRTAFIGKVITLRGFYKGDYLEYESNGTPMFKQDSGPWTLYGRVEVVEVKLRKDNISIGGNRMLIAWPRQKDGTPQLKYYRDGRVNIRAHLDPNAVNETTINQVLTKIFLSSKDQLQDIVPAHWHDYLAAKGTATQAGAAGATPLKSSGGAAQSGTAEITSEAVKLLNGQAGKLDSGVQEGHVLKKVQPEYPSLAKTARLTGDLVLNAVIPRTVR